VVRPKEFELAVRTGKPSSKMEDLLEGALGCRLERVEPDTFVVCRRIPTITLLALAFSLVGEPGHMRRDEIPKLPCQRRNSFLNFCLMGIGIVADESMDELRNAFCQISAGVTISVDDIDRRAGYLRCSSSDEIARPCVPSFDRD
jgi:hypothetical protein